MWTSGKIQPYLIHKNTLHVFNVNRTITNIFRNNVIFDNISKIKIYMCRNINVYSFDTHNFAGIFTEGIPCNKNYEYQIMMLLDNYYRKIKEIRPYKKLRRITIVANINDSEMNDIVNKSIEMVSKAGFPIPFIERYSKQYIDFPENNTIFSVISDNFEPRTKLLIELTKDSKLYLSTIPDERLRCRHITGRNLPVVADVYYKGTTLASGNGTITVEDYCKWYNLYRIHYDDNKEIVVAPCDTKDEIIRDMDVEWYDHCPIPSSVVEQCKKNGVKLGYISYLTMLCRLEEDVVDKLTSAYISPKEDLDEVLIWDGGSCEYFGIAKLFSVARKFDIRCNLFAQNFSDRIEVVNRQQDNNPDGFLEKIRKMAMEATGVPSSFDSAKEDGYNKLVLPPYFAIKRTTDPWSETTDMSGSKDNAEVTLSLPQVKLTEAHKQMTYDSVIMCPHCLHSEPVSITQTIKIQTKGDTPINHFVADVQMYRDDVSMTCPNCGSTTPSAPLIDAEIYPTIKILNEKGYYTDFSCSGHYDEYTGGTSYAYISFGPVSKMAERSGVYDNISDNIPDTWHLDTTDYFGFGHRGHVIRVRDEVQDTDPDKNYLKDILNWAKQLPNLKE